MVYGCWRNVEHILVGLLMGELLLLGAQEDVGMEEGVISLLFEREPLLMLLKQIWMIPPPVW
jgi:hypothetical protein